MSTESSFTPRALTASAYVRELLGPEDNAAILVRNRSTGHTVQTIARAATITDPDFQSWLAGHSARGYDVYMGMNPIKDGAFGRTKEDIKDIRHVYLVLDTSPGKHQVVWKVNGFSQDEAESLLHDLASKFGGDLAATDSTRVLRLPGFANHKLPEEFIVQARHESNAVYRPGDFTIEEDLPEAPRHFAEAQEQRRTVPGHHKSQSEHDWAYAKRALARGDDPEVVIKRIADFRAHDKASPKSYARRTVRKAQAELQHKTPPARTDDSRFEDDSRGTP
jgi:hypothetical protein